MEKSRVDHGPIETSKYTTALSTCPPATAMRDTWDGISVPPEKTRRAARGSAVEFGGNERATPTGSRVLGTPAVSRIVTGIVVQGPPPEPSVQGAVARRISRAPAAPASW